MLKVTFYILLSALVVCFFSGAAFFSVLFYYSKDLPDYKQLAEYKPPTVTRLHTADGKLLAEYALEKRVFVPINSIPDTLRQAFISAEDKTFYDHLGVDFRSVGRAVFQNIKNFVDKKRLVGASTITQQVAKNFLLTNEVSFDRKFKEALLAFRIEYVLSKNRILELYLNEIFLGLRSYGVAAASLNYFNKALNELTLGESAFLAGLPKGPNNYHPERHYTAAINRRNYVLRRMLEDGVISKKEYDVAQKEKIKLVKRNPEEIVNAPYFAEEVRKKIADLYGEDSLYKGGLTVTTTINPQLQYFADSALRRGLEEYDRRHGWRGPLGKISKEDIESGNWKKVLNVMKNIPGLHGRNIAVVLDIYENYAVLGISNELEMGRVDVSGISWARKKLSADKVGLTPTSVKQVLSLGDVIVVERKIDDSEEVIKNTYNLLQIPDVNGALIAVDPRNGRILAMSGGYDFDESEFNRATQALRQPGSAFKPFVYLAALESGYNPSSLVLDAPLVIDQGPGLEKWVPQNYTGKFYGPSTLRIGLEKSRNVMTVRLANNIGMEKVTELGKRLKIGDFPEQLATSLGAGETTLMKLVSAYTVMINGGRFIESALIERVQNREGKTIFKRDKRVCRSCKNKIDNNQIKIIPRLDPLGIQVIDARHAFQITWMLKGVIERGTARKLNFINQPIAGKTGTTNDNMDAWFLGFSPDLVVGVYVGFDQPSTLGDKETGGKVAAPIFGYFMSQTLLEDTVNPFRIPEGIEMVRVNAVTGETASANQKNVIYEAFFSGLGPNTESRDFTKGIVGGFESGLY